MQVKGTETIDVSFSNVGRQEPGLAMKGFAFSLPREQAMRLAHAILSVGLGYEGEVRRDVSERGAKLFRD